MRFLSSGQPLPRSVWLLICARAVNRLGAFSLPFLAVLITTQFGASPVLAGLVTAMFGLAAIPSRLAGGRLSDRIGSRRAIVAGLSACGLAQLGIAASPDLPTVIVFVLILGLVYEVYEPPSQALIANATTAATRVRAFSLLNAALAVAGMVAGLMAAALGRWDLRWLFLADALTCLICAALVHRVLPADRPLPGRQAEQGKGSPWRDRALLLLLANGTFFALVYLQILLTLPLSLTYSGLRAADAGILMTASALTVVASQPLARSPRVALMAPSRIFVIGYALLAVGLGGYAVAHTLPLLVAATVVWSLGDAALLGRMPALVADLAPDHNKGRYLAVYGTSWGIAGVVAPLIGTQLLQQAGPFALWGTASAACLAFAALQPALSRGSTRRVDGNLGTAASARPRDQVDS